MCNNSLSKFGQMLLFEQKQLKKHFSLLWLYEKYITHLM